ncbi:MAG: hypothetical protein JWN22_439 [Nocardioides sp.]|jgi:hypothetical protein|nr:hypothetical protein [Nocardioides sp.]
MGALGGGISCMADKSIELITDGWSHQGWDWGSGPDSATVGGGDSGGGGGGGTW